jgi:transcriptional regulator with XRE-family HTH domain
MRWCMEQESCREARIRLGMSQDELAKALGISQPMVSRLEANPNLRYRLALSALEARK